MPLDRLIHYSIPGDAVHEISKKAEAEAKKTIVTAGGIDKTDLVSCI